MKYFLGKSRVVGMAFEVINTTADLYKQGLVTAYRMPQQNQLGASVSANSTFLMPTRYCALPPVTVEEALVLPASRQWPAGRGAYMVCTQTGLDNPIQSYDTNAIIYLPRSTQIRNASLDVVGTQAVIDVSGENLPIRYYCPYNTSGVYLTGLSPQTTLQINFKLLIENAPGPEDILATLAHPSTDYDPDALRLYAETINKLPVGCPFDENPDGEWFSEVLGTLGEMSSVLSMVNPVFGLVGKGFGIGKQIFDSVRKQVNDKVDSKIKAIEPVRPPAFPVQKLKLVQAKSSSKKKNK